MCPSPTCLEQPTPFMVSHARLAYGTPLTGKRCLDSIPPAPFLAYQKVAPHWAHLILSRRAFQSRTERHFFTHFKHPTPRRSHPNRTLAAMGLAPTLGNSPGQGDLLQSPVSARSTPLNATFPTPLAIGGFGAGASPGSSPLLRESLLVSFPRLFYMLKFSGLSRPDLRST
ncbi:hypothetical protein JTE90_016409 [Oedothorax gibbosus]|uniref:Uncharacterized protein n=1 Tax=Oedothorax gibbosus TaxID=931172 RepID=A0AAV6TDR5_9ARAC|nr:hypothetical protein JTE90_016409 [Oedothorax gibbosus]